MAQAKSLTKDDIQQVLDYVATKPFALRNRVMFLFSLYAGLRVSEIADLRLSDVVNPNGAIKEEMFLSADRCKYRHARTVFLNTRLREELAAYVMSVRWVEDNQPLFFTLRGPRHGFSANTLAQHFHHMYRKAGVFGGSSHSGRRTFCTSLAQKGVTIRVIQSLAGHKSIQTTARYIDVNAEMKRNAVELV